MPYWAYLWPGAYLLAEAVMQEPGPKVSGTCQRFDALEIGCGLGLAGLGALARGRRFCSPITTRRRSISSPEAPRERLRPDSLRRSPARLAQPARRAVSGDPGADVIYERPLVPAGGQSTGQDARSRRPGIDRQPVPRRREAFPRRRDRVAGLSCRAEPVQSQARRLAARSKERSTG